jgi:tetratricopeptide (TPR) repeat protein
MTRIKRILLSATGLIAVSGIAFWIGREQAPFSPSPVLSYPHVAEFSARPSSDSKPVDTDASPTPTAPVADHRLATEPGIDSETAKADLMVAKTADDLALEQTVALLISPQASFLQKQATWAAMRGNPGQMDHAIALLEEQTKEDPTNAEIPAQLGLAYLMKISISQDVREQGMGGMKADLSFDAALKLDPTNWSANFLKAQALMHWPESMNMGPQVIQRFTTLIEQQESQPSRPEFAMTYQMLGEQYQKSGKTEEARQVWTRGLSYFPGSRALAQKLNPAP